MAKKPSFGTFATSSVAGFAAATGATFGQAPKVTFSETKQVESSQKPSVAAGGALRMDEALLNAKLEAVEARTETKFAQLIGKIDLLAAKIEPLSGEIKQAKDAAASGKTYILATGLTLGGLIIALFAFGWQILDIASSLFQAGGAK